MNETAFKMNESAAQDASGATIENLYPALTECFAIIMCGYLAGRMNIISETEAKGINTFVGTFSLPSLIFMSLAQLDLTSVNWLFLLSILIAKSIVFSSVIVVTLLVGRPVNLGRAGIFAIFCTQSNDFAIGYPIVAALYRNTHPDYASYLYLMAPISLAILNPISFVFMEIGRRRNGTSEDLLIDGEIVTSQSVHKQRFKMVVSVGKSICFNPIVFMTVLGVLGNLIFKHKIPCYLGGVLDVLGSAFSASALFLLGLRMVGKVHKLRGATLVVPGILIMVKLIVLPLVTREVISILHPGFNASETVDLSTYGFLYGTFPSAPTVFVFASQYLIDVDLVSDNSAISTVNTRNAMILDR
jgi:predicted permease